MLVRNPVSIAGNFKALFRSPLFAAEWGAIQVEEHSSGRAALGALAIPPKLHEVQSDVAPWPDAPPEDAPLCEGSRWKSYALVTTTPVVDPFERTYRRPICGREQHVERQRS
jgi:hypothetical protein